MPGASPLVRWLLAFALASGLGVLGTASTVEVARGFASSGELQEGQDHVAPAIAGRLQSGDLPSAAGPLPQPVSAAEFHACSACAGAVRATVSPPTLHRPTFLHRVSYWTTGPPAFAEISPKLS
jgi:hypothetical protein